jgi:hypothetical protein
MVLEDARSLIQETIAAKARKLPAYLEKCRSCWLVLVADAAQPSSFIEIDEATALHMFKSPFERTYFLNRFDNKVLLLRTILGPDQGRG